MKISPTTGKETWAFSKVDLEWVEFKDAHPELDALFAGREASKSNLPVTRAEAFLRLEATGKLPVPLQYYGAHTGRFSGCVVASTELIVRCASTNVIQAKRIVDVEPDDLIWDGIEFVEHGGVVFQGYRDVITWDDITGTADHVVFTEIGEISLLTAMQRGHRIEVAQMPIRTGKLEVGGPQYPNVKPARTISNPERAKTSPTKTTAD